MIYGGMNMKRKCKDLTGQIFGELKVLNYAEMKNHKSFWNCECLRCGKHTVVRSDCLTTGNTKSCGCLHRDTNAERLYSHGQARTKLYHVWAEMKNRCKNPNNRNYKHYGGRGITYTSEWEHFEPFYEWAKQSGYQEGLTIERKDVNKNYSPENCCWIPLSRQVSNTRRTVWIEHNGEIHNINDWAKILGINKNTFWYYVRKKQMSIAEIIEYRKCNDYPERE